MRCITSWILGSGHPLFRIVSFSFLKSMQNLHLRSGLGVNNTWDQWVALLRVITPALSMTSSWSPIS